MLFFIRTARIFGVYTFFFGIIFFMGKVEVNVSLVCEFWVLDFKYILKIIEFNFSRNISYYWSVRLVVWRKVILF